jgi:hypothetical protein
MTALQHILFIGGPVLWAVIIYAFRGIWRAR